MKYSIISEVHTLVIPMKGVSLITTIYKLSDDFIKKYNILSIDDWRNREVEIRMKYSGPTPIIESYRIFYSGSEPIEASEYQIKGDYLLYKKATKE